MSARGIPGQLRALTERVESVETSQEFLQRVIDVEVLPVLGELVAHMRSQKEGGGRTERRTKKRRVLKP